MPLTAVRHVRRMRGGAQAHLLEADDGCWYVVKFRNNPQHRRILVNELLCSEFLEYLKISAPRTAFIRVTPEFLAANPEVRLTLGNSRIDVDPGWHFGSRYPGDPDQIAEITRIYGEFQEAEHSKIFDNDDFGFRKNHAHAAD